MSIVDEVSVVGTGARGRALVFKDGSCYLLPLGVLVLKRANVLEIRVNRIGDHNGFGETVRVRSDFQDAYKAILDHLGTISHEQEMGGQLHWRSSVGNTVELYKVNGWMLLDPRTYLQRWESLEALRYSLSRYYDEDILPHWGRPIVPPATDREAGRRYFAAAMEHLLDHYSIRDLSRLTGMSDNQVSRIRCHGKISHGTYKALRPTLEAHGYDMEVVEHYLVLALRTSVVEPSVAPAVREGAEVLTAVRITAGYTAVQMARLLGFSQVEYMGLEMGTRPISKRTIDTTLEHFQDTPVGVEPYNQLLALHTSI